ncbi:hypothetical protein THMIRHAS_04240 [Thiosulfatimonas sediminis]|uniref:Type II secretion system protein GspH n=1 Tax=Thiosulfatimonas sediminis TaxID=2675054 RepID=A0A6F8PSE5_9GAMM|nr:prepilin-type N-terminal cleavage/methylation domain-containing protein [Thiosulfatimonas sediminis]BBP45051.1 hypothetical protein THMIRHAS_04240 [Thiosulfatimonas sediminis]
MMRQRGFTLLELMVVLLVIGVLLSAGMLSLQNNDAAQSREQAAKIQGLFKQAQDQATWTQRTHLVGVSAQGLQVYQWSQGRWQTASKLQPLSWSALWTVEWQLPLNQPPFFLVDDARQVTLAGWLLLPNGEAQLGQISWQLTNQGGDAPLSVLQWDRWLNFELLAEME